MVTQGSLARSKVPNPVGRGDLHCIARRERRWWSGSCRDRQTPRSAARLSRRSTGVAKHYQVLGIQGIDSDGRLAYPAHFPKLPCFEYVPEACSSRTLRIGTATRRDLGRPLERQVSDIMESGKAAGTMASSSGVDCVFLSCFDHDVMFFASMLCRGGIRLHRADTLEVADLLLLATRGTVLLLDTTFLDGSWADALAMIGNEYPLVATLVCAYPVDREFIASAQARGAFDVLWRPIELWRLRSSIWTAHEVTVERRLWLAEQEHECRFNRHSAPGIYLETAK